MEVQGRGSGGGFYTSVLKQSILKMVRFFQAQRLYNTWRDGFSLRAYC